MAYTQKDVPDVRSLFSTRTMTPKNLMSSMKETPSSVRKQLFAARQIYGGSNRSSGYGFLSSKSKSKSKSKSSGSGRSSGSTAAGAKRRSGRKGGKSGVQLGGASVARRQGAYSPSGSPRPAWNPYLTDGEKYKLPKAKAIVLKVSRISKHRTAQPTPKQTGGSRRGAIDLLSPPSSASHAAHEAEGAGGVEERDLAVGRGISDLLDDEALSADDGVDEDTEGLFQDLEEGIDGRISTAEDMLAGTLSMRTPGRSPPANTATSGRAAPPSAPAKKRSARLRRQKVSTQYSTPTSSASATSRGPSWSISTKFNVDSPENGDLRSRLFLDSSEKEPKKRAAAPPRPVKLRGAPKVDLLDESCDALFADDFEDPADDQLDTITRDTTPTASMSRRAGSAGGASAASAMEGGDGGSGKALQLGEVVEHLVGKLSEMDAVVSQERARRLDLEMRLMHAEMRLNHDGEPLGVDDEGRTLEEAASTEPSSGNEAASQAVAEPAGAAAGAPHGPRGTFRPLPPAPPSHALVAAAGTSSAAPENGNIEDEDEDDVASFLAAEAIAAAASAEEAESRIDQGIVAQSDDDDIDSTTALDSSLSTPSFSFPATGSRAVDGPYAGTGSVNEWIDNQLASALKRSLGGDDDEREIEPRTALGSLKSLGELSRAMNSIPAPEQQAQTRKLLQQQQQQLRRPSSQQANTTPAIIGEWLAPAKP
jgi:hypothetical protein